MSELQTTNGNQGPFLTRSHLEAAPLGLVLAVDMFLPLRGRRCHCDKTTSTSRTDNNYFRNTTATSEKSWVSFQGFKLLKQLLNSPSSSPPPENVGTGRTEDLHPLRVRKRYILFRTAHVRSLTLSCDKQVRMCVQKL